MVEAEDFHELASLLLDEKIKWPDLEVGRFTSRLDIDRLDVLAESLLPDDPEFNRRNMYPVLTTGAGRCFYCCASRYARGHEFDADEFRVRILR